MDIELRKEDIFLFLIVTFSLNFFSASFAQTGLVKSFSYTFLLLSFLISFKGLFKESRGFSLYVRAIVLSIIVSICMAYISWDQSFEYSGTTIPYLVWLIFFYLVDKRFSRYTIEAIVFIYGIIYIGLYLFQYFHSQTVYFGFAEEFREERGTVRINFPGAGVFFLSYFIALVRLQIAGRFRWLFASFLIVGLWVVYLQAFRQSILLILAISFFHFVKSGGLFKRLFGLGLLTGGVLLLVLFGGGIYEGLMETQKETASEGARYVRVLSAEYFIKDFSPNMLSRIFGNGVENIKTNYGRYLLTLADNNGYFASDVGLVGMYVLFGIFPVIAYVMIFIKGFRVKVSPRLSYLKYYLFFLLATCLTSDAIYSPNFIIATVFVLYLFQLEYNDEIYYRNSGI